MQETTLEAINCGELDVETLEDRIARDGYVYLKKGVSRKRALNLRQEILDVLHATKWTDREGRLEQARRENHQDADWLAVYTEVQKLYELHALAYDNNYIHVIQSLTRGETLVHPRKMVRIMLPEGSDTHSPAHQDYRVVQGTVDCLTVWIPLGDYHPDFGGLRIAVGSQKRGLLPVDHAGGVFQQTLQDSATEGLTWATADFEAGDAVIFHALTLHAGAPNLTDSLRISADFRYQSATAPVNTTSLLPYYFPWIRGWETLSQDWRDRAPIDYPADLKIGIPFDPLDNNRGAPVSQYVAVGGEKRD